MPDFDDDTNILLSPSKNTIDSNNNNINKFIYTIPDIADITQNVVELSPRYRACDPLFGGVGKLPVMKNANSLNVSEYSLLAFSGNICTV